MINSKSQLYIFNPGEVIRRYRITYEGRGLTLREAAQILDLNHSFLNKIETGERKPSLENLLLIGKEYGIPFNIIQRLAEFYRLDLSLVGFQGSNVNSFNSKNTFREGVNITWTIQKTNK